MAKIKLPSFTEGSLLKRTLLYVGAFVAGTLGFVAVASLIVVSVARSILPSHGGAAAEDTTTEETDKPLEATAATPGKVAGTKVPRTKRPKATVPTPPPATGVEQH